MQIADAAVGALGNAFCGTGIWWGNQSANTGMWCLFSSFHWLGAETEGVLNRANLHVVIEFRSWEGKKWFARYSLFLSASHAPFPILCFMQFGVFGIIFYEVCREIEYDGNCNLYLWFEGNDTTRCFNVLKNWLIRALLFSFFSFLSPLFPSFSFSFFLPIFSSFLFPSSLQLPVPSASECCMTFLSPKTFLLAQHS